MQALAGMAVVERARHMRQHQPAARIAPAQPADRFDIVRIRDAAGAHDVQHQHAVVLVAQLPHPLRREGLDRRLARVRHIGIEPIGLDADENAARQKLPHFGRIIRPARRAPARVREWRPPPGRSVPAATHSLPGDRCPRSDSRRTTPPPSRPGIQRAIASPILPQAVAAIRLEKHGPGPCREMARVKQVRVDVVDALRQEAVDGAVQQRFVACRQFGRRAGGACRCELAIHAVQPPSTARLCPVT